MMNPNNHPERNSAQTTNSQVDDIICCRDNISNVLDDFKLSDANVGNQNDVLPKDQLSFGLNNNSRRPNLVHSVSIIVEPAMNATDEDDFVEDELPPPISSERRNTIAGPITILEDLYFDQPKKAKEYDDVVQSLFASARLRKEEFAKLLEEHDQIVKEINKAETNMI